MGGATLVCTGAEGSGVGASVATTGWDIATTGTAEVLGVGFSGCVAGGVPNAVISGAGVGCVGRSTEADIEIEGDDWGRLSVAGLGVGSAALLAGAGVGADGARGRGSSVVAEGVVEGVAEVAVDIDT